MFDDLVEEVITNTKLVVDELGEERRCYGAKRGGGVSWCCEAGRGGKVSQDLKSFFTKHDKSFRA
jgi:hypothetical protein